MANKKKVGRPPFYRSANELQKKIDQYFNDPPRFREVIVGPTTNRQVVKVPMFTISGLALYLGFCDRWSLYEYEKISKFTATIKNARARITQEYEEQVGNGNAPAIFMLKNLGYSDKQEIEHSGGIDTGITIETSSKKVKV